MDTGLNIRIRPAFFALLAVPLLSVLSISCNRNQPSLSVTPEQLLDSMIHNPSFIENANGESFCWHARVGMESFVENFRYTGKKEWLDAGTGYYDFLLGKRGTDPDGYNGWIGKYLYNTRYWLDALVGDAILYEVILDFCILATEDPDLKDRYGEKVQHYIHAAERDFFEKWDFRGCWIDDGPFGSYIEFDRFMTEDNTDEWILNPGDRRIGVSHPFNKQLDAGSVCLKLYRLTGNERYRERAQKVFFTAKSHFQYFDGHYCWNYYEPLYPGDIDLESKTIRHGVWVHPWRSGYQARDVDQIVEAYHYGLVFNEEDIRRIIRTNLEVMWNGDRENPVFISSNGLGAEEDTVGLAAFKRTYGHSNATKNSGELWTALLDFDQTIRDLYELRFRDKNSRRYLRYRETVLADPPGFSRKYAGEDVTVPELQFTESRELNLAAVLPHILEEGKAIIVCQSWDPGELSIDLLTLANEPVLNLYRGSIEEGVFMITWDGAGPAGGSRLQGRFKVRWSIGTGYREFPIEIR